jgi:hypothetical protein
LSTAIQAVVSAGGAAAGCSTLADSYDTTGGDDITVGYWESADTYVAGRYTSTQSYTMCGVEMYVKKTGTPTTQTLRANLYELDTDKPGALLCTSDWVAVSTFGTSLGWVKFPFSSACNVTTTYDYEIGLESNSGSNGANSPWLQTGTAVLRTVQSADGSNWTTATTKSITYKTYK